MEKFGFLVHVFIYGIPLSLWSCLLRMYRGTFLSAIQRHLFWIVCNFLFLFEIAAAHAFVIRGIIIEVYIRSEHLIYRVEL